MKKILFCLLMTLHFQLCKADCLACWTLEPVNIRLTSGESIEGFILWNKVWLRTVEEQAKPFTDQVVNFHKTQGRDSLQFFEELFVLGEHLPLKGFVASTEDSHKLGVDQIKNIEMSYFEGKKLSGAGQINILEPGSIELLKSKPFSYLKESDDFSEQHFLSYNPKFQTAQLDSISKTKNLWTNRKKNEVNGVITLIISWD